jgi:hypothetical protein
MLNQLLGRIRLGPGTTMPELRLAGLLIEVAVGAEPWLDGLLENVL